MDMRSRISAALKQAMKEKAAERLATLRLINAAIKDREIAQRGEGEDSTVSDSDVLEILAKMIKQRQESTRAYEEGGRLDLAEREQAEIGVIEDFLPRQLGEDEVSQAITETLEATGAGSIRDMGRVMAALKAQYAGRMDFGKVGPMVKERLCRC
ncbi:MAG: GatB/YqeY domain-containing protein [Marinibacterium sp.]